MLNVPSCALSYLSVIALLYETSMKRFIQFRGQRKKEKRKEQERKKERGKKSKIEKSSEIIVLSLAPWDF